MSRRTLFAHLTIYELLNTREVVEARLSDDLVEELAARLELVTGDVVPTADVHKVWAKAKDLR